MFYFDKEDASVLFQDIRTLETTLCDGRRFEIKPDIQADFTAMPYGDGAFSMIIFDPPHLKCAKEQQQCSGWQMKKYGSLPKKGWESTLSRGFRECFRVVKEHGFVIFKWSEVDIPLTRVLALSPYTPVLGHKSGKRQNTHWVLFIKDEAHKRNER